MMKSISLFKPTLNPKYLTHCSNSGLSFTNNLASFLAAPLSLPTFRLVPHAQASGSNRSVWDQAAEEFFLAKRQKPKERENPSSWENTSKYTGNARSGRRELDEKDKDSRTNGENRRVSSGDYQKAVSFAGREWGDTNGEAGWKSSAKSSKSTWSSNANASASAKSSKSTWSSNSNASGRSSKSSWANNSTGLYRNDRGGGYGKERQRDLQEDEEISMDPNDWPKREALNWRLEGEALYGVSPIRASLLAERREFFTLYVQEKLIENLPTGKRKDKQAVGWILKKAYNLKIKVETVSKQQLNLLVENRPHQGLVLDASPLELVPCESLETPDQQSSPVWVALDEIIDPQNFGAILRSCHFLGATGVVVCAKNSAPLSGVVSKASGGALEVMEIQSCRNMMKFLETSVGNGWRAVGASSEMKAVPIQELEPGFPTILVLGNEGRGLRTNVKRSCTELVSIKGFGSPFVPNFDSDLSEGSRDDELQAVDSLNVSVAAGILLHDLLSRSIQSQVPAVSVE